MELRRVFSFVLLPVAAIAMCGCGTTSQCCIRGHQVVLQQATLSAQEQRTIIISCPPGKKALGGGFSGTETSFQVFESRPFTNGNGWQVSAKSAWLLPSSIQADVYVVCVTLDAP